MQLSVDIALELFDQLVLPVMLYGCEVWGYCDISELEILHRKYIKLLLGLYKCTPNVMVYGESGCVPVQNHVLSRMTTFYMRLINGNKKKLSYIMYKVLREKYQRDLEFACPWIEMIKNTFDNIGMGDLWMQHGMGQKTNYIKQIVKLRIRDIYLQEWYAGIENHDYCDSYRLMKRSWGFEKYLINLNYIQRTAMCKFRCRSSYIPITKTRFTRCDPVELECPLCDAGEIGNEKHYLTNCRYFAISRKKHLGKELIEHFDYQSLNTYIDADYKTLANTANFMHDIITVFKNLH